MMPIIIWITTTRNSRFYTSDNLKIIQTVYGSYCIWKLYLWVFLLYDIRFPFFFCKQLRQIKYNTIKIFKKKTSIYFYTKNRNNVKKKLYQFPAKLELSHPVFINLQIRNIRTYQNVFMCLNIRKSNMVIQSLFIYYTLQMLSTAESSRLYFFFE